MNTLITFLAAVCVAGFVITGMYLRDRRRMEWPLYIIAATFWPFVLAMKPWKP